MPIDATQAASAFALGLAGAGHCLGMCGGIAAALNLGRQRSAATTLSYHAGRIASYTLLGTALGFAAGTIDVHAWTVALRYAAGLLMIAMGLSIGTWWYGMNRLETMGASVWRPVQAFSQRWLPIRHWRDSFALGLCWGLMPCGLIYSSLAWASTAQSAATSGAMMFLFGMGTLPAMLATSLGAQRIQAVLRNRGFKKAIAVLLILSGIWTLYIVAAHQGHSHPPPEQGTGSISHPQDHSKHH